MLWFSGDDTHSDWSIGIELRTGEPHIKSNPQCINDHYSLLNDLVSLFIEYLGNLRQRKFSGNKTKYAEWLIGVTEVRRRKHAHRFKLKDERKIKCVLCFMAAILNLKQVVM